MTNGHLNPRKLVHREGEPEFQGGGSAHSADCPEPSVWLEYAAGLRPQEADVLLHHAGQCGACAQELKDAIDLLNPPQVDEAMPELASATPEWQQHMAQSLAAAASAATPTIESAPAKVLIIMPKRTGSGWQRYGLLAACVAALAVLIVGWRTFGSKSDARLLAAAYNKQRRTELRIPGGDPVDLASETRGSSTSLAEPSELLELKLRAQQHLDQAPDSPYWHQVLGQIQVLEQDGMGARRNLEIAQAKDENLPGLQGDLAAAWFEIGDKTSNKEAYAEAAELYSRQLQEHPSDPALLHYNLALCWERQGLIENALGDLRTALPLEHSKAWRQVIQDKIDRLSGRSISSLGDGYELDLEEATEKLLPQWDSSPEARVRIEKTARLGLQHHDAWLTEWIASNHTALEATADGHLASAVALGRSDNAAASLAESEKAIPLYRQSRFMPGLVRAELARLHAFQRLGQAADCLSSAKSLEANTLVVADSELQAQVLLDRGDCAGRAGDLKAANSDYTSVELLGNTSKLPLAHLNALTAEAEVLKALGMPSSAWNKDVAAIDFCLQIQCSTKQKYSVMYNMVAIAQELGQNQIATVLMRTAERLASVSGSANMHAYAVEILGTLTGRVGDYGESELAFQQAFALADNAHTPPLYRALWNIDQAEILSRRGRPAEALTLLQVTSAAIRSSDYGAGRVAFFQQKAISELKLDHKEEAIADGASAVAEAERTLSRLHSTAERQQWGRENAPVYAALVDAYLRSGQSTNALRAWEQFRSAPYTGDADGIRQKQYAATQPSGARVLVIARVSERYIGWLTNTLTLEAERTVILGDQQHIHQSAITFYHLCADRDSNLRDIHGLGTNLYSALLAPLATQVSQGSHLWIDLDPSLSMLPIPALTGPGDRWLGGSSQITMLAPWWSLNREAALQEIAVTPEAHAVVLNGFSDSPENRSEAPAVARFFSRAIYLEGSSTSPEAAARAMASAELFHFAGHADSSTNAQLLLATNNSRESSGITPAILGAIRLPSCHLAVLAGCNTSATDPDRIEDVRDLREALLLDGAHAVVASNWDVDDHSTHSLMLKFYKDLMSGVAPSQALRAAQHSVGSTQEWQHPYFWAAFQTFS